jgi:hypothetical protein
MLTLNIGSLLVRSYELFIRIAMWNLLNIRIEIILLLKLHSSEFEYNDARMVNSKQQNKEIQFELY